MTDAYQVQPRSVVGKTVSRLRRDGVLPASIYGRGLESVAIQLPYVVARDLMNAHGYNALVTLQVEGEAKPRPVVVKQVAQNPVTRELWHVDFYQVDLSRKITGPVPLVFVGESPAVRDFNAVLVVHADTVEVEALPADMPISLDVSLDSLVEYDTYLYAKDIVTGPGVDVISDDEFLLAAVTRPRITADGDEEGDELVEGEQVVAAAATEESAAEAGESTEEAAAE